MRDWSSFTAGCMTGAVAVAVIMAISIPGRNDAIITRIDTVDARINSVEQRMDLWARGLSDRLAAHIDRNLP